uniref:CRISPR system Cms protein Csm2 n=1 Tax=Fervidobacterium thailandense TaxID=1008305 RepID=A0A7C4VSW4_9BACT
MVEKLDKIEKEVETVLNIGNCDPDGSGMIQVADKYASKTARNVTTTQIRKVFNQISKLAPGNSNCKYSLNMILVNFIYNSKRHSYPPGFTNFIVSLIKRTVESGKDEVRRFKDFFEAYLAYHKYHRGK